MHRHIAQTLATALLLSGCSAAKPGAPQPATPPPTLTPRQSEIAAEVAQTMDPEVDPCQDFYAYACGGWLERTELPGDKSRWIRSFDVIRKQNKEHLRQLLEQPDDEARKIAPRALAFYQSCMDVDAIEARGATPLGPMLQAVEEAGDLEAIARLVARWHTRWMSPLFSTWVGPDARNPQVNILRLSQRGLGLPDRAFYLEDRHAELRAAYEAHIARMFTLLGRAPEDAAASAASVVAFETELARRSLPRDQLRDPDKTYNKMDLAGLSGRAGAFPWAAYFDELGVEDPNDLTINAPTYFEQMSALVGEAELAVLKDYLTWNLARASAPWLHRELDEEHFAFWGKTLNKIEEQPPRWERCVDATDRALGFELGELYVARHFAGDSRDVAMQMVDYIEQGFAARLTELEWMDDETRARAAGKLGTILEKIGYPDTWRDYSSVTIAPDAYFENQLAARRFEARRRLGKYRQPVDLGEWYMSPPVVNAYYTPFGNQIVFPAGILQPPFFDRDFPAAMNFGGVGMVIGHEITHGFDDGGRKFDEAGTLTQWWQPEAIERFEERAACVERHYSAIEVQPGHHINGKLTLGENIADLGGLRLAWRGYQRFKKDHPEQAAALIDGMSDDQLFFVAFAQTWCSLTTPENEQLRLLNDSHSPPRYRVNATLANLEEFHAAFACGEDAPMRAEDTCEIW